MNIMPNEIVRMPTALKVRNGPMEYIDCRLQAVSDSLLFNNQPLK